MTEIYVKCDLCDYPNKWNIISDEPIKCKQCGYQREKRQNKK
jgi:hypothetical protein